MEPVNLGNIAVMITAKGRTEYLKQTLASWEAARGIADIHSFTVALGYDEKAFTEMVSLVSGWQPGCPVRIHPDSTAARRSNGMGRAIAECVSGIFAANPEVEFIVMGEEDVVVSDDVLEEMLWGARRFADDKQVLLVNGHDEGGQGWNEPGIGALNGDADQWAMRLNQSFNPWCWGTWRDRWTEVLEVGWDYECSSGGLLDSGHDHMIARRIIPRGNFLCLTPDASRSQNIGKFGGWAADPAKFESTQSASFRTHREPGEYVLLAVDEPARALRS